ncbi:unnamed protein product [Cyprideis torosa]|uniref:Uncharacterized protein n=1 Tax=Cyprideis torosa TaxID=163714 RepID=A0A7R8WAA7_9CRUS|nr:unnamed protein product [Cyprideis torosa]CAG0885688.1 unnamed protein product [Cyprideis torosa]
MASWVRFRQRGTAGDEGKSGNRACQNSKIKEGKENSPNVSPSNSFGEPDRGKNNAFRKRSVAEENTSGSKWGAWRKSAADSRQTEGGTSSTKGHHQGPLRGGDGQAHNNQEFNREKLLWPQMCKKLADLAKELDMLHERLSNRDDELRSLEAIKRETEEKLLRQLEHERKDPKQIIDDLKVRIHSTESEKQNLQKQVKNVNERLSQQERTLNEGYQQKLHEMTVRMARQQESFNHKMKALEASQKALEASHQKTKEVLQTHHENEMERLRAKFLEKLEEQELNSRAKWEQIEHNLQQELLATKEAMESYLQECDTLRDKLSLTERRFEEIKAAYYGIQGEYFQGKKEVEFIKYELNRIHEEQYRERKDWERHVKMEREEATAKIGLVEGRLKAIQVAMSECVSHLLASLPSLAWSCACSNPLEGTHGTCLRCILEAVIQKSNTDDTAESRGKPEDTKPPQPPPAVGGGIFPPAKEGENVSPPNILSSCGRGIPRETMPLKFWKKFKDDKNSVKSETIPSDPKSVSSDKGESFTSDPRSVSRDKSGNITSDPKLISSESIARGQKTVSSDKNETTTGDSKAISSGKPSDKNLIQPCLPKSPVPEEKGWRSPRLWRSPRKTEPSEEESRRSLKPDPSHCQKPPKSTAKSINSLDRPAANCGTSLTSSKDRIVPIKISQEECSKSNSKNVLETSATRDETVPITRKEREVLISKSKNDTRASSDLASSLKPVPPPPSTSSITGIQPKPQTPKKVTENKKITERENLNVAETNVPRATTDSRKEDHTKPRIEDSKFTLKSLVKDQSESSSLNQKTLNEQLKPTAPVAPSNVQSNSSPQTTRPFYSQRLNRSLPGPSAMKAKKSDISNNGIERTKNLEFQAPNLRSLAEDCQIPNGRSPQECRIPNTRNHPDCRNSNGKSHSDYQIQNLKNPSDGQILKNLEISRPSIAPIPTLQLLSQKTEAVNHLIKPGLGETNCASFGGGRGQQTTSSDSRSPQQPPKPPRTSLIKVDQKPNPGDPVTTKTPGVKSTGIVSDEKTGKLDARKPCEKSVSFKSEPTDNFSVDSNPELATPRTATAFKVESNNGKRFNSELDTPEPSITFNVQLASHHNKVLPEFAKSNSSDKRGIKDIPILIISEAVDEAGSSSNGTKRTERFLARSPSSSEAESEDGDDEDESETWEAKEEALREELESVELALLLEAAANLLNLQFEVLSLLLQRLLNRENELRRRLEELEVKLQERDDEVSQLKTKIEEVDEHLHQTRAELEETQVELRKMKDATAQAKLKAEKEFEERDKEREQRIQELEKRNEELEEEVEELTAQKQDLTKRRDNANSEKEKELKFIHQALEEALTEREELQARFEKEFEFLRTVSSDREQQMLDDFEFKLREIERDYKMRMDEKEKEAECRVSNARQAIEMEMMHDREKILEEKKQAAEQMMKVLHLQSYEPEVRQLQGLVHEQQKALRVANMSCEQLKYTERNLSSEINRLRRQHAEVIARMEQEKDRQLKNELDRLKTKLNNEWEFRLKTECSRLKSELDQLHEEEKELALESQRLQSQQELQELRAEFERRESELLARVHSQSKNS